MKNLVKFPAWRALSAVLAVMAFVGGAPAQNPLLPAPPEARGALDPLTILAEGVVRAYQASPKKPSSIGRCPFSPSCSHYAMEAIHRHGPLAAALLTADRLFFREHQALDAQYLKVPTESGIRFLDLP